MGNSIAAPKSEQPKPRTASRCAPQTARGTLSLEITGYRLHKGLGVGRFIRSASLNVGGFSWCLNYYPDGDSRKESEGFIRIYLELLSSNVEARAAFHMRLVNQQETNANKLSSATILHMDTSTVFSTVDASRNSSWGIGQSEILKTSELEKSPYLHNDSLLFECDITVFKEPRVVKKTTVKDTIVVKKSPRPQPLRNLTYDLAQLLETKDGADVFFDVQGQVFPAHTTVLAMRSPVFKAQFHGPMRSHEHDCEQHVTIEDIQPQVFKALLCYIYTDSTQHCMKRLTRDEKKEFTLHLLVAADRYDVENLKFDCETFLCKSPVVGNVVTMLVFAEQHNCSVLKDVCIEFINCPDNRTSVFQSEWYSRLNESSPDVLNVLLSLTEKRRVRSGRSSN
ncbi:hypothetical protein PR202_gb25551 [Eleusine coracana subsp. coracana]|uniref:Uncharacterized protein n=1 Tax=Eleusine coracana subsp. coracana TaxID=191504 RepID=A0AAV5FLT0_ELECO|nr:hypothetical protein PR202_gb25551 [Eleusine coracana subsp. coracana]